MRHQLAPPRERRVEGLGYILARGDRFNKQHPPGWRYTSTVGSGSTEWTHYPTVVVNSRYMRLLRRGPLPQHTLRLHRTRILARIHPAECERRNQLMMRYVAITALVLLVAAGGAFYYISGNEYVFRFSEAELQEKLNAKLPLSRRYLRIFEVTLNNPRITLANGSRRVRAGIDAILNIRVAGEREALGGILDASGGVKQARSPHRGWRQSSRLLVCE